MKNKKQAPAKTLPKKTLVQKLWRRKWWFIVLLAIVFGYSFFFGGKSSAPKVQYSMSQLSQGDISYIITATGEIQPVNTVNVGSQVSGTIETIYVDYNDEVKKGDVLLEIEPSVLQASVDEAKATLVSSESKRDYAKSEYERNMALYEDGYISRSEMESAFATYEQAEQTVLGSLSQYERALTNLGYATITSPVDGTVISREVDAGQTVAASLSTPDLFSIAEDLTKMQIETSVSEADIGVVKEGQRVTFTVDAYPSKTFEGVVKQIRLSPTTVSNVVIYTVVINVDNEDLSLMPGMTAFVTIIIDEKADVLKVQNAGLLLRSFNGIVDAPNGETTDTHLAVMREGQVVLIAYEKGIESATETEIISDNLQAGDRIIVGKLGQSSSNSGMSMGGPGMGGGGPR